MIDLGGFGISIALLFCFFSGVLIRVSSASPIRNDVILLKQEQATATFPARLKIPKIKVDAPVESVGLTTQGAMGAPKGPSGVAWFNLGPRPGEKGSAVMSGHYGWKNNIPASFDNLSKLRKGDKLYVEDTKGVITTFVVRELRTYDQNQDASDVFGSDDGKSYLNLVTCKGVWNKAQKSYSQRLVVFTENENNK